MRYWLLTWTTYGTWLPGDERGSVTSIRTSADPRFEHDIPGTPWEAPIPAFAACARELMVGDPIWLNLEQAQALLNQFQETARHRSRRLRGVAIMANHVPIVVGVPDDPKPEKIVGDFKSYGSRALNRRWTKPVSGTWWTGGSGSKRKLPNEQAVLAALQYLHDQQSPLLIWIADDQGEPGALAPGES